MTDPSAFRPFLETEVEAMEAFDFVGVVPSGKPLNVVEITRRQEGGLEVRVPGRPPNVAELAIEVRSALESRSFASEKPEDRTKPWTRAASDSKAAVELALELLSGVFGEKPDAALDLIHGSHRTEVEAQKKLEVARSRVESIVSEILGRPPERDKDGDYVLPINEVHITVAPRAFPDGQIVVRVFAITNVGVAVTPELGLFLARLNFGLMFGRFALDAEHNAIWFDETLLGEFREEELRFAIRTVSSTADSWDDRLQEMFGGSTYQQVVSSRSADELPQTKPGTGTGQYL